MSGIAPILDRIASIENRFSRSAPVPQQALGMSPERSGSTNAAGTTSNTGTNRSFSTDSADYATRFDQAMAAAEAALPGADFDGTGALPPGLELISANPSAIPAGTPTIPTNIASATSTGNWNTTPITIPVSTWSASPSAVTTAPGLERLATAPVWETSGSPTAASTIPAGTPFADEFQRAGAAHDVPARLLAAVGWVESRYDVGALSPDGAIGVMQLMPGTAAELGVDPHDPTAAIDGAARLLRSHHDRFGSWDTALAAYFSGAGAVSRNGNQAPPRGAEYAQRVMQRMENS